MSDALDGIPAEDFEKPDGFKMPAPKYEAPKPQPKKQTTKKQDTKKKDSKKEGRPAGRRERSPAAPVRQELHAPAGTAAETVIKIPAAAAGGDFFVKG